MYSWEQIGSTAIDLSGYYTSSQTDSAISSALNTTLASYVTSTALTAELANFYTKSEMNTALALKQGTLTFDATPTVGSVNPVTSNGIYRLVSNMAKSKTVSIDFGTGNDTAQWVNAYGVRLTIVNLVGTNISKVKVSHGSSLQVEYNIGEVSIDVLDSEVVTVTIVRTTDAQNAVLGMGFNLEL